MEENKEYYKRMIIETIEKIENIDALIYLYTFIIGKLKAWHK